MSPQRRVQHLVHRIDEDDLDLLPDLVGDVPEVLLVLLGEDHHPRAREVRGEDLALEAADREDPTTERDLAGHRHVLSDRDGGERAHHRRGHGDPGRRAVLRDRAGRHVDVEGVLLEDLALDPELRGVGADP
jgi:hypothetical protein